MKRLTTDDAQSILYGLNLIFVKDGEIRIRGGGPAPDYPDCTLVGYIGRIAETHHLDIVSRDAESLGDEMYDCLQYGVEELEGVVAFLHAAAVQAAEMRGRLSDIEDILGGDYDLDYLRGLMKGPREKQFIGIPCRIGDPVCIITSRCGKEIIRPTHVIRIEIDDQYHPVIHTKCGFGLWGVKIFPDNLSAEAALKGVSDTCQEENTARGSL